MGPGVRQRLSSFFAGDSRGVVAAYLFGSAARGEDHPDSDIDVAVLFDTAPPPDLSGPALTLAGDLERALARRVDLVVLNSASADLDLEPVRRRYRHGSASSAGRHVAPW